MVASTGGKSGAAAGQKTEARKPVSQSVRAGLQVRSVLTSSLLVVFTVTSRVARTTTFVLVPRLQCTLPLSLSTSPLRCLSLLVRQVVLTR